MKRSLGVHSFVIGMVLVFALAAVAPQWGNPHGALPINLLGLIGVFLVPVLCVMFLGAGGAGVKIELSGVLGKIALTILFPLVLGQVLRRWLKDGYARHMTAVRRFNSGVILFIVWAAFCQSFLRDVWQRVGWADLALTGLGAIMLLAASGVWLWWGAARLGLSRESQVAAFYSGGQKSVAMGLPLSAMIFGVGADDANLSLLLLPLLIYHTAQLMLGGWMVPRFQRWQDTTS